MLFKNQSEKLEIALQFKEKYTIIDKLGEGAFSKVIQCKDAQGDYVAIKIIDLQNLSQIEKEYMMNEIHITSQNKENENVIRLLDVAQTELCIYLVMEYCVFDAEYVRTNIFDQKIPEDLTLIIFKQLVNGFKFLHKNNIMHRDIKLENIGVYLGNVGRNDVKKEDLWNATFKIIDFGLSKQFENSEFTTTVIGTQINMAPEVLDEEPYTLNADVYSLGCCLYKAVVGQYPYYALQKEQLLKIIQTDSVDLSPIQNQELKGLIQSMLKSNQEERIKWVKIYQQYCQQENVTNLDLQPLENQIDDKHYLILLDEELFSKTFCSPLIIKYLFANPSEDQEQQLLINMFENLDLDSPNQLEQQLLLEWQYQTNLSWLIINTVKLINTWMVNIQQNLKQISYIFLSNQFQSYIDFLLNLDNAIILDVSEEMNREEDKFFHFSKFHSIRNSIKSTHTNLPSVLEQTKQNSQKISQIVFKAAGYFPSRSGIKALKQPTSYLLRKKEKNNIDHAIIIENNAIIFMMTKRIIEDSIFKLENLEDEDKKKLVCQVQGKLYKTLIYLVLIKGYQEQLIPLDYDIESYNKQISSIQEVNYFEIPNRMAEQVSEIQDKFSIKYE